MSDFIISDVINKYPFLRKMNKPAIPVVGRENELNFMYESMFLKKRMKNIMLIGNAGSGKTALVEEFGWRHCGKCVIVYFDFSRSLSDSQFRGQYEEKISNCIKDIEAYNKGKYGKEIPAFLFIDEFHTSSMSNANDCMSLSDILKPALSEGTISIIGATTPEEYKIFLADKYALNRRFSPLLVQDLGGEEIIKILAKFGASRVNKGLCTSVYSACANYLNDPTKYGSRINHNPDFSIEILDKCLARSKNTGEVIDLNMIMSFINGVEEAYSIIYKEYKGCEGCF